MDERLHIELLGGFRATYESKLVLHLDTPRLQALLSYVALHRGTPQSRYHLAFTFWPDSTEKQALTNLRKLLHLLRSALPDADRFLHVDTKTINWPEEAPFTLDVAKFERALARADEARQRADANATLAAFEEATGLYRGELLPRLYDDWILPEREHLHQQAVRALEGLTQLLEGRREYAEASRYGERLLKLDPLREPTYRLLMRLHALHGDRASALRVYRNCSRTLMDAMQMEPEPATQALHAQLTSREPAQEATSTPATDAEAPLVGRQAQWTRLRATWDLAVGNGAHLLTITGEAGIGKTRLAEELLHWAARQRLATARSRAYAAEGRMAFSPIVDWLRSKQVRPGMARLDPVWLAEVARLLPEIRQEYPELSPASLHLRNWERPHLFEALARGLLASGQPMLLLLDDVQWCDPDTLEWLRFLFRFAPEARLLLIGTVRVEEVGPDHAVQSLLRDPRRAGQVTEVALDPLDAADTVRLAEYVAQRKVDAARAAQLFEETEGHPLFVVESVRAGLPLTRGVPPGEAPPVHSPLAAVPTLPPSVQAVLRKRIAQLSPLARALAGLAAVAGRTFTLALITTASKRDETELAEALDELWQRRIIREQEAGVYDFSHDKLRETAYGQIAPSKRRLLHRRVAEALEVVQAQDGDAISAQVAVHYEQGGLIDRAIASYQRAARVAQRIYANDEVVRLLTRALELLATQPEGERRDEQELALHTALGPSLVALRGYSSPAATRSYERARDLCSRLGQPSQSPILRALASAYVIGGKLKRGHKAAEELLELGRRRHDSLLIVEGHYVLGISSFWLGRFVHARKHLESALANYDPKHRATHLTLYAQDPQVVCLSRLAWVLWYLGYPEQAAQKGRECLALTRELDHPFSQAYVLYFVAHLFIDLRDARTAEPLVDSLLVLSKEQGFPLFELTGNILRAWLQIERGAVEAGITELQRGVEAMPRADVYLQQSYALGLLAQGALKAGRPAQGRDAVVQAFAFIQRYEERFFEAELHRIRGALLVAESVNEEEAEAHFQQALAVAGRQQAKTLELRAQLDLSRLWHSQGKVAAAQGSLQLLCTWFAGADSPDLAEARALLASWS